MLMEKILQVLAAAVGAGASIFTNSVGINVPIGTILGTRLRTPVPVPR
jgi:hypothetical protein